MSTTELVAKLRSTKSESKRKLLDEAADTIERLEAERNELAIAALREQEELADLLEAKRKGRLVVLPCKLGDMVYFRTYAKNATVDLGIQPHKVITYRLCMVSEGEYTDTALPEYEFGRTVFLTREEAEKALKEDA